MEIQGMTIEELKVRVENGIEVMTKEGVWELLKYAAEAEMELEDYRELKTEAAVQKIQLETLQFDIDRHERNLTELEVKNDQLEDIIEQALDIIKGMNLEDSSDVDHLITTLEGGLK